MRVEQLKAFLKVAELKSVTAAGKSLFLTQPSVTTQIKTLEDELGFELFEHQELRKSGMILTERGSIYLFYVRQALAMLEEGRLEAMEAGPVPFVVERKVG